MIFVYHPTTTRRVIASAILVSGFLLTLAVKLLRGHSENDMVTLVLGAMPNLVCGAVTPFAVMIGYRTILYRDFLLLCLLLMAGLIVYEILQLTMQNRVFDWNDIGATTLGGLLAILFGRLFFRRDPGQRQDGL